MKKVLFIAGAILFFELPSQGQQACTPDPQYTNTSTQRGIHPDSATFNNVPPTCVNTSYSRTLTVVVPPDTSQSIFTFTWDSTVLTGGSNLPPGITYACWNQNGFGDPNRCAWKGNSIGCVILQGTPTTAGTYNMVFQTLNYGAWPGSPTSYTVTGYKIVVDPCIAVNENPKVQILQQNNPNPFGDKSEILFTAEESGTAELIIYNMIGTVIKHDNIKVKKGINRIELDAKNFDSGIYFYSVVDNNNNNSFTRKMIVNK